jgi:uncharacterized protein (TIGR02145 family)
MNNTHKIKILLFIFLIGLFSYNCNNDEKSEIEPIGIPPVCSITSPIETDEIEQGDTVIILVSASDEDGSVIEISISIDSASSFILESEPYSYIWYTNDLDTGYHTISAIAKDDQLLNSTDKKTVKINQRGVRPVADFVVQLISCTEPSTIQFVDSSKNTPTSWLWNFGDGESSDSKNPAHIYQNSGTYSVSLKTNNKYGMGDTSKTINITDLGTGVIIENINFNTELSYGSVADIDGNEYKTIEIGTQTWMAENLAVTKYNDATSIPLVTDDTEWDNLETAAYCWYDNELAYKNTYGALYNWYVCDFETNGGKNICPVGWHVPDSADIADLLVYLGGDHIAGPKLKEAGFWHWYPVRPLKESGSNESGFTAIPGGLRATRGNFNNIGYCSNFWSTTTLSRTHSRLMIIGGPSDFEENYTVNYFKYWGASIRCIKD